MRLTGTLRAWHADRGFGFISPTHGGAEIFAHVTAFPRDGSTPTVGEKLSYELGRGDNGKPRAINIHRQALGDPGTYPSRARPPPRKHHRLFLPPVLGLAIAIAVGGYGYSRYARQVAPFPAPLLHAPTQTTTATPAREDAAGYSCDGRTYCSQRTSCAEAKFFLRNCPGTKMDGDNDGVPCEQQWCASPFAR